ncbi:hypothetical protein B484DRAFT_420154 [Ochromonadaceae sp. CCMP2298]|nr:hypothetical protein B484DRAFT_420154 [Ochromonadaceae sp. CCMP2298]
MSGAKESALILGVEEDEEEVDEPILADVGRPSKRMKTEPTPSVSSQNVGAGVLLEDTDDKDEVDEPLPMELGDAAAEEAKAAAACSAECSEALFAIGTDCWDISSWMIFLEEVQQGRGGDTSLAEAFERMLEQFPRSARFWKNLAELLSQDDVAKAEEAFKKGLFKCRSVDLWMSYMGCLLPPFRETLKLTVRTEQYNTLRAKCNQAFEQACENVGLSLSAYPLWRAYVDFVKSWPESGMIESGEKLHQLRSLYQRAVCVGMDQAEEMWAEYESFEKSNGEQSAEAILPDFSRKYLNAKSIMKERKKMMCNIVFDRLATPPTGSKSEMQQLEFWNSWINFEVSGPDYLTPDSYRPMVRMVFEQCLCCFRYNSEIWLSYARFEAEGGEGDGVPATAPDPVAMAALARAIYLEAVDANPRVTMLRVGLAELEEGAGSLEAAKEVLRVSFEQLPSAFTFSLYQKLIRRTLGIAAARRLYSETLSMRKADPQLGVEISLADAKLELEVNCSPQVALNVLTLAQKVHPHCLRDIHYIKAVARILMRLGDLKQIRWVFQTALREANPDNASIATKAGSAPAPGASQGEGPRLAQTVLRAKAHNQARASLSNFDRLQTELELWEEYLGAECVLGLSDVFRLDELRRQRDRVRGQFEEAQRAKMGVVFSSKEDARAAMQPRGVYSSAQELAERYDPSSGSVSWVLPLLDRELQARVRSRHSQGREEPDRVAGASVKRDQGALNMSTEFHLSMVGLPVLLRNLLAKLPFHSGPPPDIDGFVRHVKSIILPPRPEPEDLPEAEGETGAASAAPAWMAAQEEEEDAKPAPKDSKKAAKDSSDVKEEDVFRKRRKVTKKK